MESKKCNYCEESQPLDCYSHERHVMCKKCNASRMRKKVDCIICNKTISYGNMSKHMYIHNPEKSENPQNEQVICTCGKVTIKKSLYRHLKSAQHIREVALLDN